MQAIKAIYKDGNIQLLSPMPDINEAELFIIVLDKDKQSNAVASSFRNTPSNSEEEFQALGLANYFDTEDDNNVDWEELFDVKPR
ncbi:MAG: hypothetical protein BVN35_15490 [Proteobacteria bacterium ST_bin11]|nr:MAG: hypothetical protein BVN35_15490 [Proteobacteria bacterium ST_bin11]